MTEAEVDSRPDADFILGGFGYFTSAPAQMVVFSSATAFGWHNDTFFSNITSSTLMVQGVAP